MKLTWQLFNCMFGDHQPGALRPAVGHRLIRICKNCGTITEDVKATGPMRREDKHAV